MPAPRMAAGDARSWIWPLLVLPVALAGGWLIGQMPTPTPAPAPAAAPPANPAPAAEAPRIAVQSHVTAEPREREAPREELSSWTSYSAALDESRRNGKPILLDFNAAWCPPCRRLQQEVFADGGRGHAVQVAVVPVSVVDRRREDGSNPGEVEDLQNRHGIDAFPTLVVFSPRTGRSEKVRGYLGPDATVEWIRRAADQVR